MAKRTATSELNHDNWNDEDDAEEAGSWKPASSEAIQGRVIKQARRKLTNNSGETKTNVFAGFSGFVSTPTANAFNINFVKQPAATENGDKTKSETDDGAEKEYLASLKVLNETVSTWIADHVKKNPCCVLTPIFQDYEKHLKELESKRSSATKTTKNEPEKFQFTATQSEPAKPSQNYFGSSSNNAPSTSATPASTFSFKSLTSSTAVTSTPLGDGAPPPFSFNSKPTFGTAPPFSFGLSSNKPLTAVEEKKEEAEEGEDDEDTPPKVEVKPVQEEDAYYSVRCKLFYTKDGTYAEKGVGTLHLKKVNEGKTQLVIRADTTLGNILLNILLNPQLTTKRHGKNNVMLVCIPNPPIDPKSPPVPTPMLLRVKTDVEADELLAKLDEAKK